MVLGFLNTSLSFVFYLFIYLFFTLTPLKFMFTSCTCYSKCEGTNYICTNLDVCAEVRDMSGCVWSARSQLFISFIYFGWFLCHICQWVFTTEEDQEIAKRHHSEAHVTTPLYDFNDHTAAQGRWEQEPNMI